MKGTTNHKAITISVGNFIREIRQGNHKPSMNSILKRNGVHSASRARSLVAGMVEHKIIKQNQDGSYSLTKLNYDSAEVMSVLLTPRKAKTMAQVAVIAKEEINPLSTFSSEDLVRELRERGYTVTATRQVTEEL